MQNNPFQTRQPNVANNDRLRTPQREAYAELAAFAANSNGQEREIGIVLPVGCGKSGCITLTPFAFKATRTRPRMGCGRNRSFNGEKMRVKIFRKLFGCFLLIALMLNAQETAKPSIKIVVLPSDQGPYAGDCALGTAGYLENEQHKTQLSTEEIGKFISSNLDRGYAITIYPPTSRGIFVDMECVAEKKPATKAP